MASGIKPLRPLLRGLFGVGVLIVTAWLAHGWWQQRQLVLAENQAVELQNQSQYPQAAAAYEAILPRARGDQAQRLRHNAAACYVAMAEEPSLNRTESFELYRKAFDLDPSAITNAAVLERLQSPR